MDCFFSTKRVAKAMGLNISRLSKAVWEGRLPEPTRGPGGVFLWSLEDAQRASWYFNKRDLTDMQRTTLMGKGASNG